MSARHWLTPVSANFATASRWSGDQVPGQADAAILDAAGNDYTVTATTSETVDSIETASNATLAVTAGLFTANAGTGGGANAGTIIVRKGAEFVSDGPVSNAGTMDAAGGALTLVGTVNNTGLLEATSGGDLVLQGDINGHLWAGSGSTVNIDGATITGGATLNGFGTGTFQVSGGNSDTFDGTMAAVNNLGALDISTGATLVVEGSIANSGSIEIDGDDSRNNTAFLVGGSGATLTGGGVISLGGAQDNAVIGSDSPSETLTNVNNLIVGSIGTVGDALASTPSPRASSTPSRPS